MNLLRETLEAISDSGHTVADVVRVGSSDGVYGMPWDAFAAIADVEYDNSWGSAKVATDLVVVFADGQYLKRGEYDGSEWWETNPPLPAAPAPSPFASAIVSPKDIGWCSLAECNAPGGKYGGGK